MVEEALFKVYADGEHQRITQDEWISIQLTNIKEDENGPFSTLKFFYHKDDTDIDFENEIKKVNEEKGLFDDVLADIKKETDDSN